MADSDMHVWIDTTQHSQAAIVTPYIVSEQPRDLQFRLRAVRESSGGRSVIGQSGTIRVLAKVPAALSRLSLGGSSDGHCEIEITLTSNDMPARHYVFECPP